MGLFELYRLDRPEAVVQTVEAGPLRRPWSWLVTGWHPCLGEPFRYPSPC